MIYFINIECFENTYFSWKQKNLPKAFFFEYTLAKDVPQESRYYHINKADSKVVFIKKKDIVFVIVTDKSVQFQLIEAILDYISDKFIEIYGESILNSYDAIYDDFFKGFNSVVEKAIKIVPSKNGRFIDAFCKYCKKTLKIYVKNSLIENSTKKLVPLVFNHQDHALLLYIDTNFIVRSAEIISISG